MWIRVVVECRSGCNFNGSSGGCWIRARHAPSLRLRLRRRRAWNNGSMNVVFDLGAVLIAWEPAALLQAHFPERAPTAEAAGALARSFFRHEDWLNFDCGIRSVDEVVARTAARLGLPADRLHELIAPLGERFEPIAETVELLASLRTRRDAGADLRLYYLSNMPLPYARALQRRMPFLEWFDGGLFSGDVKLIKPDSEIYEMLAWRHGFDPARTLFIDDTAANVEAARALGWRAIHCTSPKTLAAQVERHLAPRADPLRPG
jgi:putative hydrolase of the HAD superfamily